MVMGSTSITCGIILILIGLIGYGYGISTGSASLTALIPAAFGLVIAILGAVATLKPDLRKHLMHVAVIVALLGFIMSAGRMVMKFSQLTMSPAVMSQLAMAVVCLIFVILAVRSFAAARRNI
jgi:putative exporter of polyketide antibiotics